MRVLIIEDEPRAARQLQSLLQEVDFKHEVIRIIDSVEQAVQWLSSSSAELIFMDIQLADGLSFEIFRKVEVQTPIIFTTAFDQYAIQAFKVNSIDYLLKPVQKEDLQQSLLKFKNTQQTAIPSSDILKNLLSEIRPKSYRGGILVKEGSGYVQLRMDEMLYFYSEESLTFGVSMYKRSLIDETMDQLLTSIDPQDFFRINRGQIVSRRAIIKIENYFNHRLKLSITQGENKDFIVSRQRTSDFKDWLNR